MLVEFFSLPAEEKQRFVAPGTHGQTGYTGLLVETAASADVPGLEGDAELGPGGARGPSAALRLPAPLRPAGAARGRGPGHHRGAQRPSTTASPTCSGASCGSSPSAIGCHETFFDVMLRHGPHLTRAIHYPAMDLAPGRGARVGGRARRHQPDHRAAPGHGPRPAGPDRRRLDRRRRPRGPGHHQHRDDARAAHERRHPDRHPPRRRRRPARRATATASSSSATRRRGPSSPRCPPASPPSARSATAPSPPATSSTRCSGRSTSSRTAAGSADRREPA